MYATTSLKETKCDGLHVIERDDGQLNMVTII